MKMKKLFSVICLSAGLMLAMPMVAGAAEAESGAMTEQNTETPTTGQTEGTAAPETDAPMTEVPVTDAPAAEPPVTEVPSTEAPVAVPFAADVPQTIAETEAPKVDMFSDDGQGNVFYYDGSGNIYSGWLDKDGQRYYLNPNRVSGIVKVEDVFYLFNNNGNVNPALDGALVTGMNGLQQLGDSFYSFNPDGHFDTGWKNIGNRWYYFSPEDARMVTGLIREGGRMYYTGEDGVMRTGDFKGNDGVTWYYANKSGQLITGWRKSNGKWYYYSPLDGRMAANSWITVNNKDYFVTGSGAMLTGWQRIDGNWYYMDGSGSKKTGWVKSKNKWYYLQPGTGIMVANDWINVGGKYYYLTGSGAMKTGWLQAGSDWYYLNSNGSMATGWKKVGSKWYYLNGNGTMKANCWMNDAGKWYYLRSSGAMATGWLRIDGNWYLFNNSGAMKTGWQISGNKWYYMDGSGKMLTGWQNIKNTWYYLNSSGAMQTGWLKLGAYWYFFDGSGSMHTGWLTYNATKYYLDPDTGRMYTGKHNISGTVYDFKSSGGIPINLNDINGDFRIVVDRANNYINVYKGNTAVKSMLCSTGMNWATPTGNFSIQDKLRWHELDGPTWGQYCSHITSEILFHSVPMPSASPNALVASEYNKLGQFASHGCIRLNVGDAKWLFDNCPIGTPVKIGDNLNMTLPKPKPTTIPLNQTWDPTDPYFF